MPPASCQVVSFEDAKARKRHRLDWTGGLDSPYGLNVWQLRIDPESFQRREPKEASISSKKVADQSWQPSLFSPQL